MTLRDFFLDLFQLDGARDVNTAAPEPEVLKKGTCIAKISFDPVEIHEDDKVEISYELSCSSPKVVPNITINGKRMGAHTT